MLLFLDVLSELSLFPNGTDDVSEEDEFSSLWSTTSSFIFLFISSLFYNIILSLVKVNMWTFSAFDSDSLHFHKQNCAGEEFAVVKQMITSIDFDS